jgi:hypothetical protein
VQASGETGRRLPAFLREAGIRIEVTHIRREHVEAFVERLFAAQAGIGPECS